MNKLLVIGSSNTDMVVKTERFPGPGETVLGGDFFMFPGGKGANQAVAAARMGVDVGFICSLGDDLFGRKALAGYKEENLNIDQVLVHKGIASGVALITINREGENEIVVASGANLQLTPEHLKKQTSALLTAEMLLTQLEIPLPTVEFIASHCRKHNLPLILNPAPAQALPDTVLDGLFLISPNQTEAEILSGIRVQNPEQAHEAAMALISRGVRNAIITMGSGGAYYAGEAGAFHLLPPEVEVVDTTAAGDVFNGVLAAQLCRGASWKKGIAAANKAAALAVTRLGAQASAPYLNEL
jgi:ribokinase